LCSSAPQQCASHAIGFLGVAPIFLEAVFWGVLLSVATSPSWSVDDPDLFEHTDLDCDRLHQHAQGHGFVIIGAGSLDRDPFAGDVFVFRGRGGSLIHALWHDGIGLSL
jgi:hypothetical protein